VVVHFSWRFIGSLADRLTMLRFPLETQFVRFRILANAVILLSAAMKRQLMSHLAIMGLGRPTSDSKWIGIVVDVLFA
jgi:hypothetical protein